MTHEQAVTIIASKGLSRHDASTSLDHMLMRVGYSPKAIDRTIEAARQMDTFQLVRFFGMDGARAAIILSRR